MAVRKISMAAETVKNNQLRRMSNETYTNRKRWHNTEKWPFWLIQSLMKNNYLIVASIFEQFCSVVISLSGYHILKQFGHFNGFWWNSLFGERYAGHKTELKIGFKWLYFWSNWPGQYLSKILIRSKKLESSLNERILAVHTVTLLNYCYFYTVDYI